MVQGLEAILPQICAFFSRDFGFFLEPVTFPTFFSQPYLELLPRQGKPSNMQDRRYSRS